MAMIIGLSSFGRGSFIASLSLSLEVVPWFTVIFFSPEPLSTTTIALSQTTDRSLLLALELSGAGSFVSKGSVLLSGGRGSVSIRLIAS